MHLVPAATASTSLFAPPRKAPGWTRSRQFCRRSVAVGRGERCRMIRSSLGRISATSPTGRMRSSLPRRPTRTAITFRSIAAGRVPHLLDEADPARRCVDAKTLAASKPVVEVRSSAPRTLGAGSHRRSFRLDPSLAQPRSRSAKSGLPSSKRLLLAVAKHRLSQLGGGCPRLIPSRRKPAASGGQLVAAAFVRGLGSPLARPEWRPWSARLRRAKE
jgi:hypothetical protein